MKFVDFEILSLSNSEFLLPYYKMRKEEIIFIFKMSPWGTKTTNVWALGCIYIPHKGVTSDLRNISRNGVIRCTCKFF